DDAPSGVVCLEISPDSLVLVASTSSGSLWSWNLQPLGEPEELARDEVLVTSLAFSPDGATLAAGNTEHKIDVWNFRGRRRVGSLDGNDKAVTTIVFSPDGKALASGDAGYSTILWDVTEVGHIRQIATRAPRSEKSDSLENAVRLSGGPFGTKTPV